MAALITMGILICVLSVTLLILDLVRFVLSWKLLEYELEKFKQEDTHDR